LFLSVFFNPVANGEYLEHWEDGGGKPEKHLHPGIGKLLHIQFLCLSLGGPPEEKLGL